MNRKQKVLTVIALIAFAVIGACHYLAWPPIVLYNYERFPLTVWKELTYQEAQEQHVAGKNLDLHFFAGLKQQGGYTDPQGKWWAYGKDSDGFIPDDAKVWFRVDTGTGKRIWKPYISFADGYKAAMIGDIRMPWFMLGVIYVGLFFLLADRKEKR
jgi:hypothetical protein